MRKSIICILFIIIAIMLYLTGYHINNLYKHEKDADIILKGVVQLKFEGKQVILLKDSPHLVYLASSNPKNMIKFMKSKGWEFTEQMGAGFDFKNSHNDTMSLITRMVYSSKYCVWEVSDYENKFTP